VTEQRQKSNDEVFQKTQTKFQYCCGIEKSYGTCNFNLGCFCFSIQLNRISSDGARDSPESIPKLLKKQIKDSDVIWKQPSNGALASHWSRRKYLMVF
jgi:hypothetical protein